MSIIKYEFEQWMTKYWGGISRTWLADIEEYKETAVQTAWEVWKRFWPKENIQDARIWSVVVASRFRDGKLIESIDNRWSSKPITFMVELSDYSTLYRQVEELKDISLLYS